MILLHVHSLKSGYGSKPVCGPVSFTLQKKQLISIEGSNGSGKSTLLKTLLGELKPISGNYSWTETTRKKIAYLPQITNHELNSSLSVSEILDMYEVSDKLTKFVGPVVGSKKWIELSGGEKQKILILTRISDQLNAIILDEPYNHLDKIACIEMKKLVEKLVDELDLAVILVSHKKISYEVDDITTVRL